VRRILVTGKTGQVGWELQRTLATLGEVIALDRHGMDLANPDSIRRAAREIKPNLIVNAAAYTEVDKAEKEPDLAMAINGVAPGILAEEAKRLNAAVVHYSTDYVFDGNKDSPYTEEDAPNPLNVYGKTKLVGEQAIQAVGVPYLIFRTSWVYGTRAKNFLLTILRLAKERDELRIVNDQIGAPTWSRMIAEATAQVLAQLYSPATHYPSALTAVESPISHNPLLITDIGGIYHMTAADFTSWHGFASLIVETLKSQGKISSVRATAVVPIATAAYPLPAKRPKDSRLNTARFTKQFGLVMPRWDTGVRLCLEELLADEVHCP
jgi:dTDP-4-dehydrorhamnose reductase